MWAAPVRIYNVPLNGVLDSAPTHPHMHTPWLPLCDAIPPLPPVQVKAREKQLLQAQAELEAATLASEATEVQVQKRVIDVEERERQVSELDAKVQQEQVSRGRR